jgi:hypothetical protein
MIELSLAIIPGVSVAGIAKGNNIVEYLTEIYTPSYQVEIQHHKNLLTPMVV